MYGMYGMVWYGMYGMVSMHKSIKGGFRRIWMTDRAPYNIVFLDYLVYLVYMTTGSIGSTMPPVVSVGGSRHLGFFFRVDFIEIPNVF